jgi:sugar phosphate isomerase/epimerase
MMPPTFGLAPLGFLDMAPPDFVAMAGEAGFASVALRTRAAVPRGHEHPLVLGSPATRETLRVMADTGVRVTQVEQVGLFRDTDVASLRPMLEGAAAVGAGRLLCSGDDPDHAVVADRFAALCALAAAYGIAVDLEFMPFRAVRTLGEATRVVRAAGAANGFVCIDALHLFRSGGTLEALRALDPELVGCVQLCDAPARPPAAEDLGTEARERRLLPGTGDLPLRDVLRLLPARLLDAEVPIAAQYPSATPLERARRIHAAMHALVEGRDTAS